MLIIAVSKESEVTSIDDYVSIISVSISERRNSSINEGAATPAISSCILVDSISVPVINDIVLILRIVASLILVVVAEYILLFFQMLFYAFLISVLRSSYAIQCF